MGGVPAWQDLGASAEAKLQRLHIADLRIRHAACRPLNVLQPIDAVRAPAI